MSESSKESSKEAPRFSIYISAHQLRMALGLPTGTHLSAGRVPTVETEGIQFDGSRAQSVRLELAEEGDGQFVISFLPGEAPLWPGIEAAPIDPAATTNLLKEGPYGAGCYVVANRILDRLGIPKAATSKLRPNQDVAGIIFRWLADEAARARSQEAILGRHPGIRVTEAAPDSPAPVDPGPPSPDVDVDKTPLAHALVNFYPGGFRRNIVALIKALDERYAQANDGRPPNND